MILLDTELELVTAITSLITCILCTLMSVIHGRKLYQDLFTDDRKSISHRRNYQNGKPQKITSEYKKVAYLTYASVITITIAVTCGAIQYNFSKDGCKAMFVLEIGDKFFYFSSKCMLYLVFIVRLHQLYGRFPSYGYKPNTLKVIGIIIILVSIILFIIMEIFTVNFQLYHDDIDTAWPYFCQTLFRKPYINIMGALMALTDLVSCIGAMYFYIKPLNRIVKACESKENRDPKITNYLIKTKYMGYKYKVLVCVCAITTLLWIMLFVVGVSWFGTIVAQVDFVINPLCLILMTEYYPSDIYYEKLCYICIRCCDVKGESYQSSASKWAEAADNTSQNEKSLDTDRVLTIELLPGGNGSVAYNLGSAIEVDATTAVDVEDQNL
eukprot:473742_1